VIRISESVRVTHTQDGGVVLDILHGHLFRLNLVGSKILELLKQGYGQPEIVERLAHEFGIDSLTVETDVREFIETLEKHRLLAVRDNSPLI
jgi:hypothetical protein